jgi:hypothetical protein
VVAIRRRSGDDHRRARLARRDAAIRIVSEVDAAALEPSHLLVEALAASPGSAVVPDGAADLLDTLAATGTVGWLVAGVGRVLPDRLFAAMRTELDRQHAEHTPVEVVDVNRFARIAGPTGLVAPDALRRRVDCPVAPELLRLA